MLADLSEGEFCNQDGSFRKLAILLVVTKVFPFDVDAVKFRKGSTAVIRSIWRDRSSDENP